PHYARAAVVAQGVYAHEEALSLARRGLSLLQTLSPSTRRDASELELQLILAPSYRVTLGWAAPELGSVLDRALALCDKVGTAAQRAQTLYGMQSFTIVAGQLEKSTLITEEMVRIYRETGEAEPPRAGLAIYAGVKHGMGRFRVAVAEAWCLSRETEQAMLT